MTTEPTYTRKELTEHVKNSHQGAMAYWHSPSERHGPRATEANKVYNEWVTRLEQFDRTVDERLAALEAEIVWLRAVGDRMLAQLAEHSDGLTVTALQLAWQAKP